MVENNHWIRLSVFYSKLQWHMLITRCLYPLLTEMQKKQQITIYILSFNYQQGENIRLSLSTKPKYSAIAAKTIDANIKSYLQKNPVPHTNTYTGISGFFMDMPVNSLKYNMFGKPEGEAHENTIRYRLSSGLIKSLCNDPVDNAHIFSFLLYAQASVLNVFYFDQLSARNSLNNILSIERNDFTPTKLAELKLKCDKLFQENHENLSSIINEVWNDRKQVNPTLKWLNEWKNSVTEYFKRGLNFELEYSKISYFIVKQLNFPDKNICKISSMLLYKVLCKPGDTE